MQYEKDNQNSTEKEYNMKRLLKKGKSNEKILILIKYQET